MCCANNKYTFNRKKCIKNECGLSQKHIVMIVLCCIWSKKLHTSTSAVMSRNKSTTIEWEELLDTSGNRLSYVLNKKGKEGIFRKNVSSDEWEEKEDGSRYQLRKRTKSCQDRCKSIDICTQSFNNRKKETEKCEQVNNLVHEFCKQERSAGIFSVRSNINGVHWKPSDNVKKNSEEKSLNNKNYRTRSAQRSSHCSLKKNGALMILPNNSACPNIGNKSSSAASCIEREYEKIHHQRRLSSSNPEIKHLTEVPMKSFGISDGGDADKLIIRSSHRKSATKTIRDRSESSEIPRKNLRSNEWNDYHSSIRRLRNRFPRQKNEYDVRVNHESCNNDTDHLSDEYQRTNLRINAGEPSIIRWEFKTIGSDNGHSGKEKSTSSNENFNRTCGTKSLNQKTSSLKFRNPQVRKCSTQTEENKREKDWSLFFVNIILTILPLFLIGLILRFLIESLYFEVE